MRHTSQYFSWELWNEYLEVNMAEYMNYLRQTVLDGKVPKKEECSPKSEPIGYDRKYTKEIPTWLAHKPVFACRYGVGFGDDSEDAQYLSVGRAQYDQENASVKVLRHTGTRWSRQSEEVPIHRLGYMMQLFLSAIRLVQSERAPAQTSLHEEIVIPEELDFLRAEIHAHREEIVHSLNEIRALLSVIDLEKI